MVLGATGNLGIPVVKALSTHPARFNVTAVTRNKPKASLSTSVQVIESDLSTNSTRSIFEGQDAIVSCLATASLAQQKSLVDIALESGVRRFIPSEYDLDSMYPDAKVYFPVIRQKIENVEYIRKFEDQMSWTTLITGSFFDFKFQSPPASFGFDVPDGKVKTFDGGDVPFETTTLAKIGETIAAVLSPQHLRKTEDQVVFVNSFTTTQNEIVKAVEDVTGRMMGVEHDATAGLRGLAFKAMERHPESFEPVTSTYGQGGLNQYSSNPDEL